MLSQVVRKCWNETICPASYKLFFADLHILARATVPYGWSRTFALLNLGIGETSAA